MGEKGINNMIHDFVYVSPDETAPVRKELESLIHDVQNEVREYFTFQYQFVGSTSRNMITMDRKSNIGYDFDVYFEVNDDDEEYDAKEIRIILKNAIDKHAGKYGYAHCEDSTRVLRIKKIDHFGSRIIHSCEFAIVNDCGDGQQQYIRYNKNKNNYTWEYRQKGFGLEEKADWLKKNNLWQDVRDYYIDKKNYNQDPNKKSISLYAETINEMYKMNHPR